MDVQIIILFEIILWLIAIALLGYCGFNLYHINQEQKNIYSWSIMMFFFFFLISRLCTFLNVYVFNYRAQTTYLINYPLWYWLQIGYAVFSHLGIMFVYYVIEKDMINTKYLFSTLCVVDIILTIVNYSIEAELGLILITPILFSILLGLPMLYIYLGLKSSGRERVNCFIISIAIILVALGIVLSLPEARLLFWSLYSPYWFYAIFAPVFHILGTLILVRMFNIILKSPTQAKALSTNETLTIKRNNLIKTAEKAIADSKVKVAMKNYEKAAKMSKKLGELNIYNECINNAKELKLSLIKTFSTLKPVKEAPEAKVKIKDVIIKRGGEVIGGKIVYKVKIQNNTDYNITDVNVFLISYPKECMGLSSVEKRSVPKIESKGFRSLEFEFEPHKDCVEGTIHASVTYIDQLNKSNTAKVHPFTIRSVCDLLKPYKIQEEDFDNLILNWQKTGEFTKVNENIYNLLKRSELVLKKHNFHVLSSKLYETEEEDQVRGVIKSFAEGKYAGKKIGMIIEILGTKKGELSRIKTSSTSEDEAMMASPIAEVMEDFKESGLSMIEMSQNEQETFIKEKLLQSLSFVLIIQKKSGLSLFSMNYGKSQLDSNLVSGFITALSSFGTELSGGQTIGIKKMEYESLKIILQQGDYINVGLILNDFPEKWLNLRLKTFVKAFEDKYKPYLVDWDGNIEPFEHSDELFYRIFEIGEEPAIPL
ncbi:MAG: hypothetical protein EU540_04805 [Promethearchaeota archaeon]|nr:MAG: hypothetical protein EU540_04805 [Candidatus Lokiarchaeota archaeon]